MREKLQKLSEEANAFQEEKAKSLVDNLFKTIKNKLETEASLGHHSYNTWSYVINALEQAGIIQISPRHTCLALLRDKFKAIGLNAKLEHVNFIISWE